ncbi:MAG TPA: hypothetical protein DDZ80_20995 [Cyanobacteria bacterium UBA8803]|nr:hypothetical protein [Cyanobacteria bacterium UBA9273]HBL60821.1 hypothetical protein [Cyanobacteria bacterium UBA8803]
MTKPTQLVYPTVDLFLYDLRDGLGQYPLEINRHRQKFGQKMAANLDEKELAQLAALENPEADYVPLLAQPFDSPLDGYSYALQLGDIYALHVACAGEYKDANSQKRNNSTQNIENLSKLKQTIVAKINQSVEPREIRPEQQGTIGQTWLISVQIADSNQDPQQLAKACYEQITPNPNWKPDFKEQGRLLGARVFEYWHLPTNWTQDWEEFSQENYHIIICLFPAGKNIAEIRQKLEDIYLDFTRLFGYRHKIIWSYWQSRRLTAQLKKQSVEIRDLVAKVKDLSQQRPSQGVNLNELQLALTQSLPSLSDYAFNLNDLEFQANMIKVNLENYKKRLQKLERESTSYLKILANFSDFTEEKYLQQIETDCSYLRPGLILLENLIRTIGSTSQIEQTKRDRTLNTTVAVVGLGLAISCITATVLVEQMPPAQETPFFLTVVFWGSICTGLIAVAIALVGFSRHRYRQ